MQTHTSHVLIDADYETVFQTATDYEQVTQWAKNFIFELEGDAQAGYTAHTPFGPQSYTIRADKGLGVADHVLDGQPLPIRVVPLGPHTLVTFTLILPPDVPAPEVEKGIKGLDEELHHLKRLVEG